MCSAWRRDSRCAARNRSCPRGVKGQATRAEFGMKVARSEVM